MGGAGGPKGSGASQWGKCRDNQCHEIAGSEKGGLGWRQTYEKRIRGGKRESILDTFMEGGKVRHPHDARIKLPTQSRDRARSVRCR